MKIYLCRHGQTTGDIEDRYGGDYDDHLTKLGVTQAQLLADSLKSKGIEKIFVSPLIRAKETAGILGETLNLVPEVIPDLKERNQNGIVTGMIKSEAKIKYPELVEQLRDYKNTIEGAENFEDFSVRITRVIGEISKMNCETIAIVTHGGPIMTILRQTESAPNYKIEDCAFAELMVDSGKMQVLRLDGITKIE
jgi:broad specificity phosphatase PhoE